MPTKFSDLIINNKIKTIDESSHIIGLYPKSGGTGYDNCVIESNDFNSSLVHKNGVETINGNKTFNSESTFNGNVNINNSISLKSTNMDILNNPMADKTIDLYWKDKNGVNCAIDTLGTTASGNIYRNIRVKAHNSNTYGEIGLVCDSNDEFYTYAPTPPLDSNNQNIATTEWVRQVKAFDLFDYKWSDHLLNDHSWLRADTFSWQDGTVYSNAYNHMVADYQGGTSQTETVGSYTITYVLATDGHKITTDETNVANIYNESGVAWYYILDTTNQRFKLPRGLHGTVVQSYQNGTDWYRVYSDGWCEQGGTANVGANSQYNGTFLKPFKDANICFLATDNASALNGGVYGYQQGCGVSSNSEFYLRTAYDSTVKYTWQACGYISGYFNDIEKYLYFYVGQFTQTATEQTAGLNSELFNGKVDLDLNNMNPSATVKETIDGWGMADYSSAISLSTLTSSYTAPSNGFITFTAIGYNNAAFAYVDNVLVYQSNSGQSCSNTFPIKKGSVFTRYGGSAIVAITFIPCIGG